MNIFGRFRRCTLLNIIICITSLIILLNSSNSIASLFRKTERVEDRIKNYAQELNKTLPQMGDKDTQLNLVSANGKTLSFMFKFVYLNKSDINRIFYTDMQNGILKNICSDKNALNLFSEGVNFDYIYYDKNNNIVTRININKSSCR